MTIFSKIARGEIPADIVYEDDQCVAFTDIAPQAPVHLLVIPRTEIEDVTGAGERLLGHLMQVAARLGQEHCPLGFRIVANTGPQAGQTVAYLHLHVLGGRALAWPPG